MVKIGKSNKHRKQTKTIQHSYIVLKRKQNQWNGTNTENYNARKLS